MWTRDVVAAFLVNWFSRGWRWITHESRAAAALLPYSESNIPKPSGKFPIFNYQLLKIGLYVVVRALFLFLLNSSAWPFIGAAQLDLSKISKLLMWLRVVNVPRSQSLYGYCQLWHGLNSRNLSFDNYTRTENSYQDNGIVAGFVSLRI